MMRSQSPRIRHRSQGLTLVEMMVSIAIGMVILTAMALLFANNSRTRSEIERASHKIENGRFALEILATELEHAGYLAELDPRLLPLPAVVPDACATAVADLKAALGLHVQGEDGSAAALPCLADVRSDTDVIVVRRAATCVAGVGTCAALDAGAPGFQASSCNDPARPELATGAVDNFFRLSATAADFDRTRRDCATAAEIRRYLVRIFYIANNDRPGDGIPTLKRAELGATGFTVTSLAQGVENLQVEYGMDTNADGSPDVYGAAPDLYLGCSSASTPTCVEHWASVVTAKLFVLSRNAEPTPGHTDAKVYTLGRVADAATGSGAEFQVGPFSDRFKRSVFQEVVRLQNASARRLSPP